MALTTVPASLSATALTLTTAAQPNITSVGTLTSLTVDDITINGSTISDAADLLLDVGGDISLDADGGDIRLLDGGTQFGKFTRDGGDFLISSSENDKDIKFAGADGGANITALTLDMSDGGRALFGSSVALLSDITQLQLGAGNDFQIGYDGTDAYIRNHSGGQIIQRARTGFLFQANATSSGADDAIRAAQNGAVTLYYDGSAKIATTSAGINVTGHINATNVDASNTVYVGTNNSFFRENVVRFNSAGAAYFDHNTVGQNFIFRVGNSSTLDTTALTIASNGNVGIGGTAGSGNLLNVFPNSGNLAVKAGRVDSTNNVRLEAGGTTSTYLEYRGYLGHIWDVDTTEVMRINSSGNVLIGATTSSLPSSGTPGLEVAGSGFAGMAAVTRFDNNAYGPSLFLVKSRAANASSHTIVANNDNLGAINWTPDDGTNRDTYAASIAAKVDGTPGANDMPARLEFMTTANAAATPTERMRIDSNGDVGIGADGIANGGGNRLAIDTATNAYPVTSGSTQTGGALRLRGGDNAVLDFGLYSINTWIQATDKVNLANAYNLSLNPNGGKVGIGTGAAAPSQTLHVAGATLFEDDEVYQDTGDYFYGGLVFETPIYKEYQYSWSGHYDHETNVYCPSYFMAEIVFTQHQTNGGADINRHFMGKWANNHTHHELETIHDSGSTWAMSTTLTATDHNLTSSGANGRLRIVENYGSGSYSKSTLTIRVYFGAISNLTHSAS